MNRLIYYTYFAFFALGAGVAEAGITLVWFDEFFPLWSKETILFTRFAGSLIGGAFLIAKFNLSRFCYVTLGLAHLLLLVPSDETGIFAFFIRGVVGIILVIFHNTQIGILIENLERRQKVMNLAQTVGRYSMPNAKNQRLTAQSEAAFWQSAGVPC